MSPWNLTSGKAAVILMFQHCLFQHMAETISHIMQYTIMYSIANICWQRDLKASKGQNSCLICKHFVGNHKVFLAQELLIFNWCMQCKIFLSWSPFLLFVEGSNLATYNNLQCTTFMYNTIRSLLVPQKCTIWSIIHIHLTNTGYMK